MAEKSRKLASIDELLEAQDEVSELRVTVERVPGNEGVVKVTPWHASGTCMCDAALEIPKNAIGTATTTGEKHHCCGKVLSVAQLAFKDKVWADVLTQLSSRSSVAAPIHPAFIGVPSGYRPPHQKCADIYEACIGSCNGDPDCACYCLQSYQRCRGVQVMPC